MLGAATFVACCRPIPEIGPISESACFWGLSRHSCSTPAHHSKRALRFSISTFLIGWLGPKRPFGAPRMGLKKGVLKRAKFAA